MDNFIYRCRECRNAIVDGHQPVTVASCPACGTVRDEYPETLFVRVSQIS